MMHSKGHPHVELDGFYHDHHPSSLPSPSTLPDPVERHGQQFREMAVLQKERVKQQELLSKVFSSWQQRRTESSGPVSADVIASLKRTSRLLHYCSSPILLLAHLKTDEVSSITPLSFPFFFLYFSIFLRLLSSLSDICITLFSLLPSLHPIFLSLPPTPSLSLSLPLTLPPLSLSLSLSLSLQGSDAEVCQGYSKLQERFLKQYIEYLITLKFHPIEERQRHPPSHPHTTHPHYKCLQRSWSGGIMLIELSFQMSLFHVKLFSLESSRLTSAPPVSNEVW